MQARAGHPDENFGLTQTTQKTQIFSINADINANLDSNSQKSRIAALSLACRMVTLNTTLYTLNVERGTEQRSSGAAINRAEHFNRSGASLTAHYVCFNRCKAAGRREKQGAKGNSHEYTFSFNRLCN